MASLVGAPGVGKSHLAEVIAQEWVGGNEECRFGLWLESEKEVTIRISYEKALRRVRQVSELSPPTENREFKTTAALPDELWGALTELSGAFDWFLDFNNVPESVKGKEGMEGFRMWFFQKADCYYCIGRAPSGKGDLTAK
jgi:hypothetical protein